MLCVVVGVKSDAVCVAFCVFYKYKVESRKILLFATENLKNINDAKLIIMHSKICIEKACY